MQHLGDLQAVLVIDETGFLKKGRHSAGVARQYSGTAGQDGQLPDRRLSGLCQPAGPCLAGPGTLCAPGVDRTIGSAAGRPASRRTRRFATKPQLAQQMLARALLLACRPGGSPATACTAMIAGCGCGWKPSLRPMCWRSRARHTSGWTGSSGRSRRILAALPEAGWTRLSAGDGAKGPRWYDWRWLPLADPLEPGWRRWLLVRRSVSTPTELTAYVVFAPQETTLAEVVRVAGTPLDH